MITSLFIVVYSLLLASFIIRTHCCGTPSEILETFFDVSLAKGEGPASFLINGERQKEIKLKVGEQYTFVLKSIPEDTSFIITSSSTGGDGAAGAEGREGTVKAAFAYDLVSFTPKETGTLYYQSPKVKGLGGVITVVDK